jgi:hypothetical protein
MEEGIKELSIIVIVGILSGVSLYTGNTEMASVGLGGLVGYLSHSYVGKQSESES